MFLPLPVDKFDGLVKNRLNKIQLQLSMDISKPDITLLEQSIGTMFVQGVYPSLVFMCSRVALSHADNRLKQDNVPGYCGLILFELPAESVIEEISNGLSLPFTKFDSIIFQCLTPKNLSKKPKKIFGVSLNHCQMEFYKDIGCCCFFSNLGCGHSSLWILNR
jgi:hypothetical protein